MDDRRLIPNDSRLQTELYSPQWEPSSNEKLVATPKHILRERLGGRSPDSFDAVALAVWKVPRWVGAEVPTAAAAPPPRDTQDAAFIYDQQAAGDPWWPTGS